MKRTIALIVSAGVALIAAAVGPAAITGAGAARSAVTVAVAQSKLGPILVDGHGRTLYLFERDRGPASTCYGACATYWPPLTAAAKPKAGRGILASRLSTTRRKDGKLEITYAGHPLYTFVADRKRGDTKGQDLDQFGGGWYVLSPKGTKVERGGS